MKRAACLLLLFAACGTSTPDAFEYKATAGWNVGETPNVTSVTIDGAPYASGETSSPLIRESDQFVLWPSPAPTSSSVSFLAECGTCEGKTETTGYCVRLQ